ncbi:MAG: hypothetical protein QF406_13690 [Verrucomicrobiota bacterium]|nr:hypothetical protein [Verrucomicrobiota bacterium]
MAEHTKKAEVPKHRRKYNHTSNRNHNSHDHNHVHEECSDRAEATREVWQSNLNAFLTKMMTDKK